MTQPEKIQLDHGGGGQLTNELINDHVLAYLNNETLSELSDSASLNLSSPEICFTTDSYVVKPLFFKGGDIGKLAVCGTVNDLAVSGAVPKALSLSLIIETGFEIAKLDRILKSIAVSADENNVKVVTGDTKTVEKGKADGIFINTAGIGTKHPNADMSLKKISPGDKIIINGSIGDHGLAVMSQRENIRFESTLESDCAGLAGIINEMLDNFDQVKFMRDPTRGGLAATLNEITMASGLSIEIIEDAIPVRPAARAVAEMLGFDLLNVANEGKFVTVVPAEIADECLEQMKKHSLGKQASIIGQVTENREIPLVEMVTSIGGRRIVQMPYGRQLPRIC